MTLHLRYAARSDVGLLRDGNEDALYAGPRLLAVADGMGGHAAGEVASRVVIETVAALDTAPRDGDITAALRAAVQTANNYLRDMVAADSALEGMGTTLTALFWADQELGLVHIGDSRAYLLRDGELTQVTHDHTFVQNLIDQGRITPDEANTHPQRSWITNALDGRPDIELDLSIRDTQPGDRYLICSDGLSGYVSEQTMAEALRLSDPQEACDRLVDLALRAGGPDNVTCIVADLVEDDTEGATPILGGAAAEPGTDSDRPGPDSPAARAAAIQPREAATGKAAAAAPTAPADLADDEDGVPVRTDDGSGSRGSRRLALVLVGVVVIVLAAAVGTFLYIRTQYYVGVADGTPSTVGVYRGVDGSVLGADLDRLHERTDLPLSALGDYQRSRVTSGIQASSASDAQRIVESLRSDACAQATATPSPRPSPSPSGKQRASNPTPTPSPPPPYCHTTP